MGLRDLLRRRASLAGRVGGALGALALVSGSLATAVPACALEGTTPSLASALTVTDTGLVSGAVASSGSWQAAGLAAGRSSRTGTELEVTAGQVTLQLDSLGPEVLTGSEDLVVTGTVANGTEEEVAGTIVVQMQRATDMTVASLGSWLTGARNGYLTTIASVRLEGAVKPGQTGTFTVQVPRAILPLSSTSQWGPRGIQAQLVSGNDVLGQARSVVVWDAGVSVDPTRVTVVVPVAATPTELAALTRLRDASLSGQEPSEDDALVRQGALARVTGLLSLARPGTVLTVDPALLTALAETASADAAADAAADSAGDSSSAQAGSQDEGHSSTVSPTPGSPDPATGSADAAATSAPEQTGTAAGSAPDSADLTGLLTALRAAVRSGRVITLPWQDADLTALTSLGAFDLVASALTRSLGSASTALWTALQPAPAAGSADAGTETDSDAASAADSAAASDPSASADPTASATGSDTALRTGSVTDSATDPASTGAGTQAPASDQETDPGTDQGEGTGTGRAAPSGTPGTATYLAGGPLDARTLDALPDWVTSVITDPWDLPVAEDLTYTPSGLTSVGGRSVVVPDPQLSGTMDGTVPTLDAPTAAPGSGSEVVGGLTELTTRQLLRAESAILTRQAPNLGRDVIVSVSRLTAGSLDPTALGERIAALTGSSWTTAQDLSTLLASAETDSDAAGQVGQVARTALPDAADPDGALTASELNQATTETSLLASTGSVSADPAALVGDPTGRLLAATAVSWRADPGGRQAFLATGHALRAALAQRLTVLPSSTINVISDSADLPVRLRSELGVDVTVTVHLDSSSTRLQADGDVSVTVPAGGEVAVTVPTRAVGSGDVEVAVRLLADDGTQVGTDASLSTRVRADWESVGTRVVAGLLALMLAAGIWRTVRRGRRSEPETLPTGPVDADGQPGGPAPAGPARPSQDRQDGPSGPDATSPAQPTSPVTPTDQASDGVGTDNPATGQPDQPTT